MADSRRQFMQVLSLSWAFQMAPVVKNSPANTEDIKDGGSIPGLGRFPEKGKATHSSILAWKIPWTEEPGRLESIGSHRVRHDWSNMAGTHSCSSFYWPYFQTELSSLLALLHVSHQTEMTYTVTGSPLPVASFPRTQQPALSELWCQQNTWIPCCYKCRPCNRCHVHWLSVTDERWNASQCGIWWGYRTSVIFRLTGS